MSRSWISDLSNVFKGIQTVAAATIKHQEDTIREALRHSSIRVSVQKYLQDVAAKENDIRSSETPRRVSVELSELAERLNVINKGMEQYVRVQVIGTASAIDKSVNRTNIKKKLQIYDRSKDPKEVQIVEKDILDGSFAASAYIKQTQNPLIAKKYSTVKEKIEIIAKLDKEVPKIELSDKEKEILRKLELEHEQRMSKRMSETVDSDINEQNESTQVRGQDNITFKSNIKRPLQIRQSLSSSSKERKVPATRLQRLVSFGTLGIGLGLGTAAEYTRRTLGLKERSIGETVDSMFLTEANAERIVSTLCKVRGAALKIGQILSIQDNTVISPQLQKAFERVRQSADFMPFWQVEKVLSSEFGHDWRVKLGSFEKKPFAAASIGQVHHATLKDGRNIAVKIQYPGVALGIQSDIENLIGIMKVWNIFPEGMFIDNLVEVAKRELSWEVDYIREAECTKKYKRLVQPYGEYYVPAVIDELSTQQVFTTELIDGIPVDKCVDTNMNTREHIAKLVMELCIKELFVFRYMQTDPNWSNFFYNFDTKQLILLDFGACRSYEKSFMDKYIEVINAASEKNRDKVLKLSRDMGFLTGYESKIMEDAHVDAVMILGQVFDQNREYFDFGGQDVTKRMQALVPTIINHRLCPPPEEIYSLHRKLSGVFLLCAKLQVRINCRDMFRKVYDSYKFGEII